MEDLKPEAVRIKGPGCALCDKPDGCAAPLDPGPGGFGYALGELIHLRQPDLSTLFAYSTGGRALGFLKRKALEETIERIGEEVHRQYILSFSPKADSEYGNFHSLHVVVKNRPDLNVRTRAGYWSTGQ